MPVTKHVQFCIPIPWLSTCHLNRRQLTPGSAQLRAFGAAAVSAENRDGCDNRRSSNGNSGLGNAARNTLVDVHQNMRDDSMTGTTEGTQDTNVGKRAASLVDGAHQVVSSPTAAGPQRHPQREHHDSTTSESAPVGFRAWVSQAPAICGSFSDCQNRPALIGLKRKASCGLPSPLRTVPSSIASTITKDAAIQQLWYHSSL